MTKSIIKNNFFWLFLALAVILFDQITKILVSKYFLWQDTISVLPFLNIFYNFNSGAAFSFLNKANGWQKWFFDSVALAVSIAIIYWLLHAPKGRVFVKISLMLILGGALGNMLDRMWFGYVRDFIDLYWKNYHWPTFNIADSAISIGAIMLAFDVFILEKKKNSPPSKY